MIYKNLSREEYIEEVHETLEEKEDIKFSKVAIGMWDFMKAWDKWPVRTLWEGETLLSVCFMKLSGQAKTKVLFISNIFTPKSGRGKGSAKEMLDRNIKEAVDCGALTIRLDCNKKSLGFYDNLGFTYWGTTIDGSMFCDLPIYSSGVDSFIKTKNMTVEEILCSYPESLQTAKIKWITRKLRKHEEKDYGHPSRYDEFLKFKKEKDNTLPL